MTEREAFEENLPAHSGTARHHKKPDDYANHHVQNDWSVWQTAWQASRNVALSEAAQLCFDNSEEIGTKNGRSLAPFPHECEGLHAGMTYAKAIRNLK